MAKEIAEEIIFKFNHKIGRSLKSVQNGNLDDRIEVSDNGYLTRIVFTRTKQKYRGIQLVRS